MSELRVALVHDWLTGMRGGEKVLEALAELFPEAPIYTLLHVPGSVSPALEGHEIHTSFLQRMPGIGRRYRSFLPFFPAAIEDLDLTPYDLVLSTSHAVAKGIIPAPDAVHLCYCHTPMRYAWDQEHTYFPRRRGLVARLRNLILTALRTWDAASAHRVDGFLANSHFVARRIRRYYGRDAEVVAPPVDVSFFTEIRSMVMKHEVSPGDAATSEKDDASDDYALVVSALAPYKRVEVAIRACEGRGMRLEIVGDGPERRSLERLAGPQTRLRGRIDGDELRRLYRGARLFLQPGVEDFGIASVEALASGTPVVAVGRGGIRDIVDDGVHGVLYSEPPRPAAASRQMTDQAIGQATTALAAAIDKALGIRFNEGELADRAQQFSKARFSERMRASISRYVAIPEVHIS